jgi:BON domain
MPQTCVLEEAPAHQSEPRLHCELERILACNPYFAGRALRVELRENDVLLSGVLGSYFHKQIAQESVLAVPGVGRVRNEIRVVPA